MADQSVTITLSGADAERLGKLLEAGGFESAEAVVSDALVELQAASLSLEDWLSSVVGPEYDAYCANPSDTLSLDDARRRLGFDS